jgi:hypothetical protein
MSAAEPKNGNRFANYVQTAATVVGLLILFWGFAMRPLESKVDELSALESRVALMEKSTVSTSEKLSEIETQFDGVTKLRNVDRDFVNRLIVPLWKKSFDIDLPMPQYFPEPRDPRGK